MDGEDKMSEDQKSQKDSTDGPKPKKRWCPPVRPPSKDSCVNRATSTTPREDAVASSPQPASKVEVIRKDSPQIMSARTCRSPPWRVALRKSPRITSPRRGQDTASKAQPCEPDAEPEQMNEDPLFENIEQGTEKLDEQVERDKENQKVLNSPMANTETKEAHAVQGQEISDSCGILQDISDGIDNQDDVKSAEFKLMQIQPDIAQTAQAEETCLNVFPETAPEIRSPLVGSSPPFEQDIPDASILGVESESMQQNSENPTASVDCHNSELTDRPNKPKKKKRTRPKEVKISREEANNMIIERNRMLISRQKELAMKRNKLKKKHQIESGEYKRLCMDERNAKRDETFPSQLYRMKQFYKIEEKLMETHIMLLLSLDEEDFDIDACCKALAKFCQLPLSPFLMKKHPDIVYDILSICKCQKSERLSKMSQIALNRVISMFARAEDEEFSDVFRNKVLEYNVEQYRGKVQHGVLREMNVQTEECNGEEIEDNVNIETSTPILNPLTEDKILFSRPRLAEESDDEYQSSDSASSDCDGPSEITSTTGLESFQYESETPIKKDMDYDQRDRERKEVDEMNLPEGQTKLDQDKNSTDVNDKMGEQVVISMLKEDLADQHMSDDSISFKRTRNVNEEAKNRKKTVFRDQSKIQEEDSEHDAESTAPKRRRKTNTERAVNDKERKGVQRKEADIEQVIIDEKGLDTIINDELKKEESVGIDTAERVIPNEGTPDESILTLTAQKKKKRCGRNSRKQDESIHIIDQSAMDGIHEKEKVNKTDSEHDTESTAPKRRRNKRKTKTETAVNDEERKGDRHKEPDIEQVIIDEEGLDTIINGELKKEESVGTDTAEHVIPNEGTPDELTLGLTTQKKKKRCGRNSRKQDESIQIIDQPAMDEIHEKEKVNTTDSEHITESTAPKRKRNRRKTKTERTLNDKERKEDHCENADVEQVSIDEEGLDTIINDGLKKEESFAEHVILNVETPDESPLTLTTPKKKKRCERSSRKQDGSIQIIDQPAMDGIHEKEKVNTIDSEHDAECTAPKRRRNRRKNKTDSAIKDKERKEDQRKQADIEQVNIDEEGLDTIINDGLKKEDNFGTDFAEHVIPNIETPDELTLTLTTQKKEKRFGRNSRKRDESIQIIDQPAMDEKHEEEKLNTTDLEHDAESNASKMRRNKRKTNTESAVNDEERKGDQHKEPDIVQVIIGEEGLDTIINDGLKKEDSVGTDTAEHVIPNEGTPDESSLALKTQKKNKRCGRKSRKQDERIQIIDQPAMDEIHEEEEVNKPDSEHDTEYTAPKRKRNRRKNKTETAVNDEERKGDRHKEPDIEQVIIDEEGLDTIINDGLKKEDNFGTDTAEHVIPNVDTPEESTLALKTQKKRKRCGRNSRKQDESIQIIDQPAMEGIHEEEKLNTTNLEHDAESTAPRKRQNKRKPKTERAVNDEERKEDRSKGPDIEQVIGEEGLDANINDGLKKKESVGTDTVEYVILNEGTPDESALALTTQNKKRCGRNSMKKDESIQIIYQPAMDESTGSKVLNPTQPGTLKRKTTRNQIIKEELSMCVDKISPGTTINEDGQVNIRTRRTNTEDCLWTVTAEQEKTKRNENSAFEQVIVTNQTFAGSKANDCQANECPDDGKAIPSYAEVDMTMREEIADNIEKVGSHEGVGKHLKDSDIQATITKGKGKRQRQGRKQQAQTLPRSSSSVTAYEHEDSTQNTKSLENNPTDKTEVLTDNRSSRNSRKMKPNKSNLAQTDQNPQCVDNNQNLQQDVEHTISIAMVTDEVNPKDKEDIPYGHESYEKIMDKGWVEDVHIKEENVDAVTFEPGTNTSTRTQSLTVNVQETSISVGATSMDTDDSTIAPTKHHEHSQNDPGLANSLQQTVIKVENTIPDVPKRRSRSLPCSPDVAVRLQTRSQRCKEMKKQIASLPCSPGYSIQQSSLCEKSTSSEQQLKCTSSIRRKSQKNSENDKGKGNKGANSCSAGMKNDVLYETTNIKHESDYTVKHRSVSLPCSPALHTPVTRSLAKLWDVQLHGLMQPKCESLPCTPQNTNRLSSLMDMHNLAETRMRQRSGNEGEMAHSPCRRSPRLAALKHF